MDAMTAPDGRPALFDGAAWVSQDGRYWWNGAAWQPIKRKGFHPNFFVMGMGLLVVAALAYMVTGVMRNTANTPAIALGVTNAHIDNEIRISFDYSRATTCNHLTFNYAFFDKGGKKISDYQDETPTNVTGHKLYHFSRWVSPPLSSSAVRFTVADVCSG
jgi:hypothetical protein